MSEAERIALQPGFILHRTPYRETSLLLEALTADYGRVGLVARGARRGKGGNAGLLQPFVPLYLSWSGRGELASLGASEARGRHMPLAGRALLSAFYLNELLLRLLQRRDPHPGIFPQYEQALAGLAAGADEWSLRLFERTLLEEIGYGLILDHEVEEGAMIQPRLRYWYDLERGPVLASSVSDERFVVQGATLLALDSGEVPDAQGLAEAKRLMRFALAPYLGNRPLRSRELFRQTYGAGTATLFQSEDEDS